MKSITAIAKLDFSGEKWFQCIDFIFKILRCGSKFGIFEVSILGNLDILV